MTRPRQHAGYKFSPLNAESIPLNVEFIPLNVESGAVTRPRQHAGYKFSPAERRIRHPVEPLDWISRRSRARPARTRTRARHVPGSSFGADGIQTTTTSELHPPPVPRQAREDQDAGLSRARQLRWLRRLPQGGQALVATRARHIRPLGVKMVCHVLLLGTSERSKT